MASVTPRVRFVRLRPEATAPQRMTAGAAGFDLAACLPDGAWTFAPGDRRAVPTGLALAIAPGFEGQVRPRSGLALRLGLTVLNAPGTIDADYRGELMVLLVHLGAAPVEIAHGDRIAQLVIAPVTEVELVEVDALDASVRGAGGFGSTGR